MSDTESIPPALPPYVGTSPKDRVRAFLNAVADSTASHAPRSEFEPPGLMGWPGADGWYHDLTEADLWALIGDGDYASGSGTTPTEALTAAEVEMLGKMLATELWVMEENQGEAHPWRGWSRREIAEHRAAVEKWRRLNGLV